MAAIRTRLFSLFWIFIAGGCALSPGCCLAAGSQRVRPEKLSEVQAVRASDVLRESAPAASSAFASLPTAWQPVAAPRTWESIVLHHSATEGATVEAIDVAHRARRDTAGQPWLGIGYHFVIGDGQGIPDGQIEPTFRWRDQLHGAHAGDRKHNDSGIGICLVGNFDEHPPTARQLAAAQKLVAALQQACQINAAHVIVHRDITATNCPGRNFSLAQILNTEVSRHESSAAAN